MNTKDGPRTGDSGGESPYSPPRSVLDPPVPRPGATLDEVPIRPQGLFRRLAGHWWQILLLWLLVCAPIVYAIQQLVEPTYEAFCTLQVEPTTIELFGEEKPGRVVPYAEVEPYLNTQALLLISDRVLNGAMSTGEVARIPWIAAQRIRRAPSARRWLSRSLKTHS